MLNKLIGTRTKTKYGARGNGLLILFLPPALPFPSPPPYPMLNVHVVQCRRLRRRSTMIGQELH